MSDIKYTSDSAFEADVLKSASPVLVDYWAEWCGPCRMIAPILDEVSKEYQGKITVAKLNVDENQTTPAHSWNSDADDVQRRCGGRHQGRRTFKIPTDGFYRQQLVISPVDRRSIHRPPRGRAPNAPFSL